MKFNFVEKQKTSFFFSFKLNFNHFKNILENIGMNATCFINDTIDVNNYVRDTKICTNWIITLTL